MYMYTISLYIYIYRKIPKVPTPMARTKRRRHMKNALNWDDNHVPDVMILMMYLSCKLACHEKEIEGTCSATVVEYVSNFETPKLL